MRRTLLLVLCLTSCLTGRLAAAAPPDPRAGEFFEAKVRPVLAEHCYSCHGEKKQRGGLRLDTRDALRKGGETGPGVVPGNLDKSLLITAIRYKHADLRMPPDKQLKAEQVAALERWVSMGTADAGGGPGEGRAQDRQGTRLPDQVAEILPPGLRPRRQDARLAGAGRRHALRGPPRRRRPGRRRQPRRGQAEKRKLPDVRVAPVWPHD